MRKIVSYLMILSFVLICDCIKILSHFIIQIIISLFKSKFNSFWNKAEGFKYVISELFEECI